MKKKRIGLWLNVVTIVMSVCAIAIGVYSVKKANLTIDGSIGFIAHNCKVKVLGQIDGAVDSNYNKLDVAPYSSDGGTTGKTLIGSDTWSVGSIFFDPINCDDEQISAPIKFTFIMQNLSDYTILAEINISKELYKVVDVSEPVVSADDYIKGQDYSGYALTLPKGENGQEGKAVTISIELQPIINENFSEKLLSNLQINFDKPKEIYSSDAIKKEFGKFWGLDEGVYLYDEYAYDDNFAVCDLTLFQNMYVESEDASTMMGIYPKDENVSGKLIYPSCVAMVNSETGDEKIYWLAPFFNYYLVMSNLNKDNKIPSDLYSKITEVNLSASVTKILSDAFRGFSGLTSIFIPKSVSDCDTRFSECSLLETVVTGIVVSRMFENLASLKNVTLLDGITGIQGTAFLGCTSLTSINIPNGVTFIGIEAFLGCSSLTSITIPNSVTSISYNSFSGCSSLTSIVVGKENAIYDSRNDCNAIIETASNTLIVGCKNTIIPSGVSSIGDYAFYESDLTSIIIPNSVTNIGEHAFERSCLTSITIPSSVVKIGADAFSYCKSFTSAKFEIITGWVAGIGSSARDVEISENDFAANATVLKTVTSKGDSLNRSE